MNGTNGLNGWDWDGGHKCPPPDETAAMILQHTRQEMAFYCDEIAMQEKKKNGVKKIGHPLGTPFDVVVAGL